MLKTAARRSFVLLALATAAGSSFAQKPGAADTLQNFLEIAVALGRLLLGRVKASA